MNYHQNNMNKREQFPKMEKKYCFGKCDNIYQYDGGKRKRGKF